MIGLAKDRAQGIWGLVVIWLLLTSTAGAFQPQYNPSLEIGGAVELPIKIDGELDDLGWRQATRAQNFVEQQPGDMIEPDVLTEALITFDGSHLYVAYVCHDDPASVRATMCPRDQFDNDDIVGLLLDTYGEAAWAYQFFVNPYGIQQDYLWSSVGGPDRGCDLIWQSAARVTDSGYQVEMAIPFSSIRFPDEDKQSWRMDFRRIRPRESLKQYSWAAYDRNEQCSPCQWGTVQGIQGVKPGRGLEIMPAVVASEAGMLNDPYDPESGLDNASVKGEMSVGAKYSISSDLTVEGAINPDFSQIEADAAQIDVNTTIALLYPE
ncbi:MAG: carbohydrate binding family 9 domain-containing protein, partial [Chitinivibrionia bacterium]|nr:carbohydrate binding family 9 domain-containing protein [Chitinivibrionia bacterium]